MTFTDAQLAAKRRGEGRAMVLIEASIAEARLRAPLVPEFKVEDDATGKRLLVPAGAMARGMLAHVIESHARATS